VSGAFTYSFILAAIIRVHMTQSCIIKLRFLQVLTLSHQTTTMTRILFVFTSANRTLTGAQTVS
jgi:hypothetical protein